MAERPNRLPQPHFHAPFGAPDGWRTWSPRESIAPRFEVDGHALRCRADGQAYTHGKLLQIVPAVAPGQSLHAHVRVRRTGRCLARMRLAFQGAEGNYLDKFWVEPTGRDGDWEVCRVTALAPPKTVRAEVELRFTGRGDESAWFSSPLVTSGEPETHSRVKIAVAHRPKVFDNYSDAIVGYIPQIGEAARLGADFVLLTEMLSCNASTQETAQPLDGPLPIALARAARESAIHVVTSIPVLHDGLAYNTAVLFDRKGDLIGQYRKVHLPPQEIDAGTTEGDQFPVFETEFCKVGMLVCYDYFFPEATLLLAQNGAQIVFLPIWGGHLQPGMWDAVTRTRAADNGVHFAASGIDVPSRIVQSDGVVVVERAEPGIAIGEVPLIDRQAPQLRVWPWSNTWPWRNCYMTERRNDVYGGLTQGAR